MILLYLTFTVLLLTALAASIGRLVQAQDDAAYERMFAYLPSRTALRMQARHDLTRAWIAVAIFGAALLCWVAWLIWGRG